MSTQSKLRDEGAATAFLVIFITALIALAALLYDPGMAVAAKRDARSAAAEAARTGAAQIDLDWQRTTGEVRLDQDAAEAAAEELLAAAGYTGTATATDQTVTVTVTLTYDTVLLGVVGTDTIPISATVESTLTGGP